MAFTWPAGTRAPQQFTIQPRDHVVGDPSPYTGAREVMVRWHQWHVIMTWNHLRNTDYWGLFGHFNNSQGGRFLFQIPIFSYRAKRGTKTGTVTLSGAHAAGATSLTITGGSGTFARGDWVHLFQEAATPRAYNIVAGETGGVIGIQPGLRGPQSSGTTVNHFAGGQILDTMELVDPSFAAAMPSPLSGLFQPFTLEFVTALRRTL